MTQGVDYSSGRPGGAAIAGAGYQFAARYLTDGGPDLPGKLLTPEEAADLTANGVAIVSVFETIADEMLGGYSAGVADAQTGLAQVLACGGQSDRPIFFACDFDATPDQQDMINAYLQGAASVLGGANVGIYGGYWPVSRALDAGVAAWSWQTQAWSGGNQDPRLNLLQDNNAGYVVINGVECDIDVALTDDYGQWTQGGDVQLTDTITDAYGNQVSVGDALKWLLYHADLTIDQLGGAGTREAMPAVFVGWPQLGGRTLVDAVATIGAKLGIDGFTAPEASASS